MTEKKKVKENTEDVSVRVTKPTWRMALPTLLNAATKGDEETQKIAAQQFATLCVIVDKITKEAEKDSAFRKRLEHINITFEEKK
tara:strand:- start:83 stop:337 length:255 start_codon:yes stop_codon:yes gene_type:complete